jgi:hypothetical protein
MWSSVATQVRFCLFPPCVQVKQPLSASAETRLAACRVNLGLGLSAIPS